MIAYGKITGRNNHTVTLPQSLCVLNAASKCRDSEGRLIMLMLAAISGSRYDFHLLKKLEEEAALSRGDGRAALQTIITVLV